MILKIINNNQELTFDKEINLLSLAKKMDKKYYACKVNGRFRELNYTVYENATVEFLDLLSSDVTRIYEAGLRYIFTMALYRINPELELNFNYNVSRSILGIIKGLDHKLNEDLLNNLVSEVDKIISKDLPINRKLLSYDEAKMIYKKQRFFSKIELMNYRNEEYVNIYECNGFYNYMFSQMIPSTGYLKDYKAFLFGAGFIIQYPRHESRGTIPEFRASKSFANALKEAAQWNKKTNTSNIAKMNNAAISDKAAKEFINLCEIKHTNNLFELASKIYKEREDIRIIAIAGPSSSGKTTFAMRLRLTLKSLGLNPRMISIDDYYLPQEEIPYDEHGEKDYETINAIDIKRFNEDMKKLVKGEKVTLPKYNFAVGGNTVGDTIKASKDEPIIIEGIHALNEILTEGIPKKRRFNIYIAPQTQLHIDSHNPISITDLRLLRRIVRDAKFRNSSAEETLGMWPSVRRGEFKWIYPFQDQADYVFSTELAYEFMVLKKHAINSLHAVERNSEHFIAANRLLKFLKYFVDIPDEFVPCNSLLREFIGGRCI